MNDIGSTSKASKIMQRISSMHLKFNSYLNPLFLAHLNTAKTCLTVAMMSAFKHSSVVRMNFGRIQPEIKYLDHFEYDQLMKN